MKRMMKEMAVITAAAAICGCQTRITATKNAEQALPRQKVVQVNGVEQVITEGYQIASGGWEATARSPLWAKESLDGLNIEVCTNGTVKLSIEKYDRDLSTNAVVMTREIFVGTSNVVSAVAKAYASIAGGSTAETVAAVAAKAYEAFKGAGGDETVAQVTAEDGRVVITDGNVSTKCDAAGNCTVEDLSK